MADSTADLLERSRQGDSQALEELLERHQAQVYRFGMKMCRNPEDAQDVLQDTLLAMARGVRDFKGASSVSTWLFAIARSFCIKKRRKRKAAPSTVQSLDSDSLEQQPIDPRNTPDDALAAKEVERALEAAIAALEPKYREVLILRDVEGLTAPEVAEVTGLRVEAVKSRLHRARRSVRDGLAPLLGVTKPRNAGCPDVTSLYSRFLEDEISAEVCATMTSHLAECERCKNTCDSLKRTLALCASTPAAQVPDSVQDAVRRELAAALQAEVHRPM
jgi:RNA polymerase sigma-70 factor (ECF subfamily)